MADGLVGADGPAGAATRPSRVQSFLRLVAIEHSVFALPFAYLAALTAMKVKFDSRIYAPCPPQGACVRPVFWQVIEWDVLLLITVAMVGARTFAMAANRIIDRHIDAQNPRTAGRELVTGAVSVGAAWWGAGLALAVFLGAAAALNPLCLALAPLAVIALVVYPYGKRFTDYPHAILGLAQAIGPIGGWLAVTGRFDGALPAVVLGVAVGLWIGGFDLIYACQDVEVDRRIGVRSVPARHGVRVALRASSVTHLVTFGLFMWFGALVVLGWLWWIGLALVAGAFAYEHAIVKPGDLSRVNRAFFTANGFIGIALFGFALADLVLR